MGHQLPSSDCPPLIVGTNLRRFEVLVGVPDIVNHALAEGDMLTGLRRNSLVVFGLCLSLHPGSFD